MAKVVKRTFSLTEEQAKFIDAKVESGQFASGSEVLRDGLRAMQERDAVLDKWLNEAVAPVYDKVKRGEGKMLTGADLRKSLAREYRKVAKAAE